MRLPPAMAAFVVGAGVAAAAQSQGPVFRSGVDAVRVDVSVMSGLVPVLGLTAAHFELTDNGVAQVIDRVSLDTVPLSIMLVLDTSGSLVGERFTHLLEASRGLVDALTRQDLAALVTFSEPIRLVTPMSRDRAPLLRALGSLKAEGATSLHDAVFLGFQWSAAEPADYRRVMLVFSDGDDTASWLSGPQVLEAARRSGVVTHAVELMPQQFAFESLRKPSPFLTELADAGGGRRWSAQSSRDLRKLFATALDELRSRYLLTYYPAAVERDGWHDVKVTLKGTRGDVIARPGYFVPSAP